MFADLTDEAYGWAIPIAFLGAVLLWSRFQAWREDRKKGR